jgi:DNA-binding transcriptional ArsR family regulator
MDTVLLKKAEKQVEICKAIGNSRRLLILWILFEGELSVNEIAAKAGSTLQNVSQHLNILKNSNIVKTRRDGQTIYYQITDKEYLKHCPAMLNVPDQLE